MGSGSKKIIVIDDDEGIVEVVKVILEENGHQVMALTGGRGIERKTLQWKPDIIFLDLWMPGIDGKEITKLLKRDKKTKHIPLVIISALSEGEKIAASIGADGFLPKPFDIDNLLDAVNQLSDH